MRRRLLPIGVLVVALAAGGWLWLRDSGFVRVTEVYVVGLRSDEQERIRATLTEAATRMTTLHVDEKALRAAVEQFPSVASVTARADFPHRLTIEVRERVPVAVLVAAGEKTPVSAGAIALTGLRADKRLATIKVRTPVGPGPVKDSWARAAVRTVAAAPAPLRARISSVRKDKAGIVATLRNGPLVVLGAARDLKVKWIAATRVLADETARGATAVDVRVPERPAAAGVGPAPEPTPTTTPAAAGSTPALTPTPSAYPTNSPVATP